MLLLQSYTFIFNVTGLVILVSGCLPPLLQLLQKTPSIITSSFITLPTMLYKAEIPLSKIPGTESAADFKISMFFKYFCGFIKWDSLGLASRFTHTFNVALQWPQWTQVAKTVLGTRHSCHSEEKERLLVIKEGRCRYKNSKLVHCKN